MLENGFRIFVRTWGALLLILGTALPVFGAGRCSQVFVAESPGFEQSHYEAYYGEFKREKNKDPRWYQKQVQRIKKGEIRSFSEAMALSDALAQQTYFGSMAQRFGRVELRKSLLIELRLKPNFPFIGAKRIERIQPFKVNGQKHFKRSEFPKEPELFFASMQALAVHVQSLAYLHKGLHSETRLRRMAKSLWPFLGNAEKATWLELSSRELAQYLVSVSEQSGYFFKSEFRSWKHHPFKILVAELGWRFLLPGYQAINYRPTDLVGLTKLATDARLQQAQRLRLRGEAALTLWWRSTNLVLMGLMGFMVADAGQLMWSLPHEANQAQRIIVEELQNPYASSQSAQRWSQHEKSLADQIAEGQRLELERLKSQPDLTPLEKAKLIAAQAQ